MVVVRWLLALLVLGAGSRCALAQAVTVNDRLVQLADVLSHNSTYNSARKIAAIKEIGEFRVVSAMASGLLFDQANIRFQPDPMVRAAAARNLKFVCEMRNRMAGLRLARLTVPANEPEPTVRMAALTSLAAFQTAEAASAVYDAANEAKEPDPTVRETAKGLIEKGLAASLF